MARVRQIRRKGKQLGLVPTPVATAPSLDSRVALIQALIPVALEQVHAALQAGSGGLGRRAVCARGPATRARALDAAGRVHLSRRSRRSRLRCRGCATGCGIRKCPCRPTRSSNSLGRWTTGLLHKVLGGLSTREYERCAEAVPEAIWAERLDGLAALHPRQCPQAARTAGPPAGGL